MIIQRVEKYCPAVYRPFIAAALEYSYRAEDTVDFVERQLASGDAIGIEVVCDDQVMAFGVIEQVASKDGPRWNIWTMAGERMAEWVSDFLDFVETRARQCGIEVVMLGGRRGWDRQLRALGYQVEAVIMKKGVTA